VHAVHDSERRDAAKSGTVDAKKPARRAAVCRREGRCVLVSGHLPQRCKKRFFFAFLTFFSFFKRFLFLKKNVGTVQSGKQINKNHFQNNSNEVDL